MQKKSKQSPYYQLSLSASKRLLSTKNVRFSHKHFQKYREILTEISERAKRFLRKNRKPRNFLKTLDEVIPTAYFGNRRHRKLFYDVVKLILTQSEFECIYVRQLVIGYNLNTVPWLSDLVRTTPAKICRRYLCQGQVRLLEKIVKPLILQAYTVVKKGDKYELELVPKTLWSSYRQKVINLLLKKGHLLPSNSPSRPLGALQIKPKSGYFDPERFRLIVRLTPQTKARRRKEKLFTREIGRDIRHAARKLSATKTTDLFRCWKDYLDRVGGGKVYGIKIDIQDAFGNINIDFMCYILERLYERGQISSNVRTYLTNHIKNQYVICGKDKDGKPKTWRWNRGLCQGDRFSSALCQLYMSYLDSTHLADLYKPTNFLHRTVDDYLFCSTSEDDVSKFLATMRALHEINERKTQSNIAGFESQLLHYYGQTISLETGEVKTLYSWDKRAEIRHRFRLWNIGQAIYHKDRSRSIREFLSRPMRYKLNNFFFKKIELNTIFNSEGTVLENFFEAMVYIAFKFDVGVMALKNIIVDYALVGDLARKVAYAYSVCALRTLEKHKGEYHTGELSVSHLLRVGIQAFILVFKRRTLYTQRSVLTQLTRSRNKISTKRFGRHSFNHFRKLPESFTNIGMQRRLPQNKSYWI
ncbi:hypothetical protein PPYR_13969 [Photinus pyralis]|uniref:Telomerase reverse transcriptase n=1 Tax=Photinus pyralis TaxID=7054 RepID=A0A5N4A3Y7_PHOPY|nr:uncharacterized protein LOC116180929 isoform X2 [Photinus pyralis]KAB0792008.1 hypothetical protein PPYR_13969 [Photinus pyralis]